MTLFPLFLEDIPISNFDFFSKKSIFLKFSNCCIIIAQTTYFENIQYCKIYFHYGVGLTKTSYYVSASFFWKIFSFQISIFFQKGPLIQVFKLPQNYSPTTYFENIKYCKKYFHCDLGLTKTSYNDSTSFF